MLPRAGGALAVVWWVVLVLRGVLPAAFAIAMGVLVGAVKRGDRDAQIDLSRGYYRDIVRPALRDALSSDAAMDAAFAQGLGWWRQISLLGLDAALDPLLAVLGAELGATRKVTDKGWQPHARQIGITGRSIAPNLYVAVALSGKFNHMVGVRSAGTILAINESPDVPVFAAADVGIVGDWRVAVPALVAELRSRL